MRGGGGWSGDVGMVVLTGARAVVSTLVGGVNDMKSGYADASRTNAGFNLPTGVAVDTSGNVFVGDWGNQRIRKVTPDGGTRIGPVTPRASVAARTRTWKHRRERVGHSCIHAPVHCIPSLFLCGGSRY